MKKVLFTAIAVFGFTLANAQEVKFGAKAGLDVASIKVDTGFGTVSGNETGFFVGGFAEIGLTDKMNFQPEINYVAITNSNTLNIPLTFEYEIMESFDLAFGPAANYLMDANTDNFKFAADLGGVYNLNENMEISGKYSYGFGDVSLSGAYFGFGYKF